MLFWVKIKRNTHSFVALCRSLSPFSGDKRMPRVQNPSLIQEKCPNALPKASPLRSAIPLPLGTPYYLQFRIELNTAHVKDGGNTVMWDTKIHSIGSGGTTSAFLHSHHWLTVGAERVWVLLGEPAFPLCWKNDCRILQ